MSTPPGLLAAGLVFWGWQTGLLPLAIVVAVVVEGARIVPWRWRFSRSEFDRLADLSTVLFAATAVYFALTAGANRAVIGVFVWLPAICLPLAVSQAVSGGTPIELATLFWTLRGPARREGTGRTAINLAYPYLGLCVLSASAANVRGPHFYAGLCGLAAWALWRFRPRHHRAAAWVGAFALVSAAGWIGQVAFHRFQAAVEAAIAEWYEGRRGADAFRTTTHIGQVGRLKLGEGVVFRVEPDAGRRPTLLREAAYNTYHAATWFALEPAAAEVPPQADGSTWRLRRVPSASSAMTIYGALPRGRGVLPLPEGAFELHHLPAIGMRVTRLGAVTVDEGPTFVGYGVLAAPGPVLDGPPTEKDLRLPWQEAPLLSRLAEELGLRGRPPREVVVTVQNFFKRGFRYAMYVPDRPAGPAALHDFLVNTRAGHCEYFATATALLLRAAGVPARYAVGYAVDEFSRFEQRYLVRARDAHAWALAWVDGEWRAVDTTPTQWHAAEAATASALEPLWDALSWLGFLVSRWRWSQGGGAWAGYLVWPLIPLSAVLIWRIYARSKRDRVRRGAAPAPVVVRPGADSEFYLVERRLAALAFARAPGEPLGRWLERVALQSSPGLAVEPLRGLLRLHYRYRFDPRGVGGGEREQLRARVNEWLARHETGAR